MIRADALMTIVQRMYSKPKCSLGFPLGKLNMDWLVDHRDGTRIKSSETSVIPQSEKWSYIYEHLAKHLVSISGI